MCWLFELLVYFLVKHIVLFELKGTNELLDSFGTCSYSFDR